MVDVNLEDPVVKGFLFYICVLTLKVFLVTFLTIYTRFKKRAVISPEDVRFSTGVLGIHDMAIKPDDEDVQRVRSAHHNDLENIPFFILSGFVYILTKPSPMIALNLFRLFAVTRFLHTFVYAVFPIPQPSRAIFFAIGLIINLYMLLVSFITFFSP